MNRRSREDSVGAFGCVVITILIAGCIAILGIGSGEQGFLVVAKLVAAVGLVVSFLVWLVRWLRDRSVRAAAAEASQKEREERATAAAAESQRRAAASAKAERINKARGLRNSVLARANDLTPDQFAEEIEAVREASGLLPQEWDEHRREVYWASLVTFLRDRDLTEHEEALLAALGSRYFKLEGSEATYEQSIRRQALMLRDARKQLPVASTTVPLKRGEVCHYATTGRVLKHTGGTLRHGDVLITSKRILVVGDGVTEVRLNTILRTEVEGLERGVSLSIEGRESELEIQVADVFYFAGLVDIVAAQARADRD